MWYFLVLLVWLAAALVSFVLLYRLIVAAEDLAAAHKRCAEALRDIAAASASKQPGENNNP